MLRATRELSTILIVQRNASFQISVASLAPPTTVIKTEKRGRYSNWKKINSTIGSTLVYTGLTTAVVG